MLNAKKKKEKKRKKKKKKKKEKDNLEKGVGVCEWTLLRSAFPSRARAPASMQYTGQILDGAMHGKVRHNQLQLWWGANAANAAGSCVLAPGGAGDAVCCARRPMHSQPWRLCVAAFFAYDIGSRFRVALLPMLFSVLFLTLFLYLPAPPLRAGHAAVPEWRELRGLLAAWAAP